LCTVQCGDFAVRICVRYKRYCWSDGVSIWGTVLENLLYTVDGASQKWAGQAKRLFWNELPVCSLSGINILFGISIG